MYPLLETVQLTASELSWRLQAGVGGQPREVVLRKLRRCTWKDQLAHRSSSALRSSTAQVLGAFSFAVWEPPEPMRVEKTNRLAQIVWRKARVHYVDELEVRCSFVSCVKVGLNLQVQVFLRNLWSLSVTPNYAELQIHFRQFFAVEKWLLAHAGCKQVMRSFWQCELSQIVPKLTAQAFLKVEGTDGSLYGDYLRVPVELAEEFEEKSEKLQGCLNLEIVHKENDKHVEGIGSHVCGMRSEQRCLVRHPGLDEQDGLFEKWHSTHNLFHEVDGAETPGLPNTDVDQGVRNSEFNDFDISSINKHDIRNVQISLLRQLPRGVFVAF